MLVVRFGTKDMSYFMRGSDTDLIDPTQRFFLVALFEVSQFPLINQSARSCTRSGMRVELPAKNRGRSDACNHAGADGRRVRVAARQGSALPGGEGEGSPGRGQSGPALRQCEVIGLLPPGPL